MSVVALQFCEARTVMVGGIEAVQTNASVTSAEDAATGSSNSLDDAIAQGVVEFMGLVLQNSMADIQAAASDSTSDPGGFS